MCVCVRKKDKDSVCVSACSVTSGCVWVGQEPGEFSMSCLPSV